MIEKLKNKLCILNPASMKACLSGWTLFSVPLQELQALDLELQEATVDKQADPFLLCLHGLVHIDRQVCSLPLFSKKEPAHCQNGPISIISSACNVWTTAIGPLA